jgi:iron complex outermembrane receptor protein
VIKGGILFSFLVLSNLLFAQEEVKVVQKRAGNERASLKGRVTNQKGDPLAGASIFIHDIKLGTIADQQGNFATSQITAGSHLIEVSHLGYGSAIENVTVVGNAQKDFVLSSIIVEQEGVTVTGVSSASRVRQSPQPVSLMKRSDLLKTTGTNIMEALTRKAGVSSISTGPAISKPVIRGLGYNRVVTVNDGVRQEGQQWGDEHGIEIDEYSVQKAEILKGPASVMYGSDALAGVVNFITNTPIDRGAFRGNLLATTNTNNNLYGFNANLAAHGLNGFNWNIYTTLKSAADYKNKFDGTVFNSRYNERNVGGYLGVNKTWGYSHLIVTNVHQNIGLIEGERDSATGRFLVFPGFSTEHRVRESDLKGRSLFTPYQTITHTKVASDNSFAAGNGRGTATIAYQKNNRQEFGNPFTDNPDVHFALSTLNYNLGYHFPDKGIWRTTIGINGMYQSNANKGEQKLIPEYNLFDIGMYVFARRSLDKLTVSGGVRGDMRRLNSMGLREDNRVKFTQYSRTFGDISGSIGLAYEASKQVVLKANLARGFRAPSIAELSSNGAHEGTNRYEYGQQNLRTETSVQMDAGFEVNTEHFTLGLSAYYNKLNNYIYYRKLENRNGSDSMVNVQGEELTAFRFDQSKARLAGFEANFDIHPHPLDWLHFENTLSFVSGKFKNEFEGTNRLPFIPAPRLLSELRADFSNGAKTLNNLYFKAELDVTATQNRVFTAYNTEAVTAGYTLVNFGAGTDVSSKGHKLFSVYTALNNVGDVAYQNHLSRLKYTQQNNVTARQGVYNMGRNFNLKLNVPLDFKRTK